MSPIPVWAAWLISIVLTLAEIVFCFYALKEFLKARKAAELLSSVALSEASDTK
jgi:hypothetical protein